MGNLPSKGWKNKVGTKDRECSCGSWKQHWINCSGKRWPQKCSVYGCDNDATLGAHVYNQSVRGERIMPACDSCNKKKDEFTIKAGTTLMPANKQKTCE